MTQAAHRFRRVPPALLAPFKDVPNVTFYNLQKDATSEDLQATQLNLIDHTPQLHDLAETAALMMNLDLVISCDTAVPHLAAAIGRPTWTLLAFNADWRWLRGSTTPWFPGMKLFRQRAPGEWQPVIDQVAAELRAFRKP
jgi:ADP-heptose:LPS heptosyltransferase